MTANPEGKPIREVVGAGVRRVRELAGVRQGDVALAARRHGLAWTQSKVAALERGDKAVGVEELALLPLVLTSACGRPVHLPELIAPDAELRVGDLVMPGRSLLALYAGRPAPTMRRRRLPQGRVVQRFKRSVERLAQSPLARAAERISQLGLGSVNDLLRWAEGIAEAEAAAGRRLGEHALVVVALSHALWGRTLTEERDRIVAEQAPDASPGRRRALRGQVTRRLVQELGDELERRAGAADTAGRPAGGAALCYRLGTTGAGTVRERV